MPAFDFLPPLSLYVHIPWCEKKCPYCDFNSHVLKDELPERRYIEAVIKDLEQELPRIHGREVGSIFIGGGTPSLISPSIMARLLVELRARLNLISQVEISLETNPGSADSSKFKGFREAGINRLSIGVQSFHDDLLHAIGRIHDGKAARAAAATAIESGFDNFNLDIMYGLPGQSPKMAMNDVRTAISFQPAHLSYYQLTIEPNTFFYTHTPPLPDDEISWRMQNNAETALAEQGYNHYEISAYARHGYRCQHNLNYWQFGDYLGIGAGAHSKVTLRDKVLRSWKVKHPADYMHKAHGAERIGGCKLSSAEELRFEFMLNTLRLQEPVTVQRFQHYTGQSISSIKKKLQQAHQDKLLSFDGKCFRATKLGHRFLNDLLQRFLPELPAD